MENLSITHRLPIGGGTDCPDCGETLIPRHSGLLAVSDTIACAHLTPKQRLQIELDAAEDEVIAIKRRIKLLEAGQ